MFHFFNRRFIVVFTIIFVAAGIQILHICRLPVLPFTDLPNHLAEAYVLNAQHNGDNTLAFSTNIAVYSPACLHAVFCSLFQNVELGNRVFYSLYLLLLPTIILLLIRQSRGDEWFALASTWFLYSYCVIWGFTGFTMGIAFTFLSIFAYVRMLTFPSPYSIFTASCLLVCTYYLHVLCALFMLVLVSTAALLLVRGWRSRLVAIIPAVPVLVLISLWVVLDQSWSNAETPFFLYKYYANEYSLSLWRRLKYLFIIDNSAIAHGHTGKLIALCWSVPVLSLLPLVLYRLKTSAGIFAGSSSETTPHCRDSRWRIEMVGWVGKQGIPRILGVLSLVLACGCLLLLPDRLPGQIYLFQRYSVFLLLSLVWVVSFALPAMHHPRVHTVIVALMILSSILWSHYLYSFVPDARAFQSLLRDHPQLRGRSLSAIIGDRNFKGHLMFNHFQNYQMVWNRGMVPTLAAEYRFRLLNKRDENQLPGYVDRINAKSNIHDLLKRYEAMDFLLIRGSDVMATVMQTGHYILLSEEGNWSILRKVRRNNENDANKRIGSDRE